MSRPTVPTANLQHGLYIVTTEIRNKPGQHYGILDFGNVLQPAGLCDPVVYQLLPPVCLPVRYTRRAVDQIADEVAAAARFAEALGRPQYNVFTDNCEHFARYVAYGSRTSGRAALLGLRHSAWDLDLPPPLARRVVAARAPRAESTVESNRSWRRPAPGEDLDAQVWRRLASRLLTDPRGVSPRRQIGWVTCGGVGTDTRTSLQTPRNGTMENEERGLASSDSEVEIIIEVVELEEHAKHHHDKHAPRAHHYAFHVDKVRVVVDTPTITGAAILRKVGKTPADSKLYQHKEGHQPILINPQEVVNLREPGVERFTTMPKDTTEGQASSCLRQDFRLPESDETYLNGLGLSWEAVLDSGSRWVMRQWSLLRAIVFEKGDSGTPDTRQLFGQPDRYGVLQGAPRAHRWTPGSCPCGSAHWRSHLAAVVSPPHQCQPVANWNRRYRQPFGTRG